MMASVVFDKIRSALGRPIADHDVPAGSPRPPSTLGDRSEDLTQRVARLAAELDRLATVQRAIEAKLQAIDARHDQFEAGFRDAEGSRAVTSTELRQAVAKLQSRGSESVADRATLTASVERLDEAHAQLRQAQNRSEERIDSLAAADRARGNGKQSAAREVQETVAQQTATLREEFAERDVERSRAFASRIAVAHVTSFVALIAALAAATIALWKQL